MAKQRRMYQVGDKIQAAIAQQLFYLSDPRFYLVTIVSVSVSPDLKLAKVYWVVTAGEARRREVGEAFTSSSGLIRSRIGKGLGLRFVPELRFFYDNSLDEKERIASLLANSQPAPEDSLPREDDVA